MDGHIIDARDGGDGLQEGGIAFTAHEALIPGGNQMVRIDFPDEAGRFRKPADKTLADLGVRREAARFVADLPGENGRILTIRLASDGIRPADDELQVIKEQRLCLFVRGELRHLLHERSIAALQRDERLSGTGPLQIHSVAAGPLPGIVQVEYGLHVPFAQFDQETIQTG